MIIGVAGFKAFLMMGMDGYLPTKRYVVLPWKMVTRYGKNMTLAEAVDSIFGKKNLRLQSERERRN